MYISKKELRAEIAILKLAIDGSGEVILECQTEIAQLKDRAKWLAETKKFTKVHYINELTDLYEQAKDGYELQLALDLLDKIRELSK